jgi:hypothetical protein
MSAGVGLFVASLKVTPEHVNRLAASHASYPSSMASFLVPDQNESMFTFTGVLSGHV